MKFNGPSHSTHYLSPAQKFVLFAVTFGNILEWYDIYLYIYWAPTIAKLFFNYSTEFSDLFNTIAFFTLGFLLRPIGGVIIGNLGDHLGRKNAFLLSILLLTVPTFLLGLLPTYSQIGIFAPILLAIIRIMQTFPTGGELPGVFCYLYENSRLKNRKFMTSFAGVGGQIGIILAIFECYLMEKFLSPSFLESTGWRISFILGGLIGLCGFYLRHRLHETTLFKEMVGHHQISKRSISSVINSNWKGLFMGIAYGIVQTVSFHIVAILLPDYFDSIMGIDNSSKILSSLTLIVTMTLPLPIFGWLGDRYGVKKLLIGSCMIMLATLFPLYTAIINKSSASFIYLLLVFVTSLTCTTAFWPYLISNLFKTSERFTCVGLSFNVADGLFGGFSTLFLFYIIKTAKSPTAGLWVIFGSILISLFSYISLKEKRTTKS